MGTCSAYSEPVQAILSSRWRSVSNEQVQNWLNVFLVAGICIDHHNISTPAPGRSLINVSASLEKEFQGSKRLFLFCLCTFVRKRACSTNGGHYVAATPDWFEIGRASCRESV